MSATRRPGKASRAASVGSTLVDSESSTNATPSTVPTVVRRDGSGVKPPAARCSGRVVGGPVDQSLVGGGVAERAEHAAGDQRVAAVVAAGRPSGSIQVAPGSSCSDTHSTFGASRPARSRSRALSPLATVSSAPGCEQADSLSR